MNVISGIVVLNLIFFSLNVPAVFAQNDGHVKTSNLRLSQIAGFTLFQTKKCSTCHTSAAQPVEKLTPVSEMRDEAWFEAHVSKKSDIVLREAKSERKKSRVLRDEIAALVDYLFTSKSDEKKQVDGLPETVQRGAYLAYANNCLKCHSIAGVGKDIAPVLTFVANKHPKKTWLVQNLQNPQQFSKDSIMPKFGTLPEEDLSAIADYLLTLKK